MHWHTSFNRRCSESKLDRNAAAVCESELGAPVLQTRVLGPMRDGT